MKIIRSGQQPSVPGNTGWFTGTVRLDHLIAKQEATKAAGALVTRTKLVSIAVALLFSKAFGQTEIPANAVTVDKSPKHYTFTLSEKVSRQKVAFKNRYGITLSADLYLPKNSDGQPLAAIAISGPFGAVKEQSSGLYAQTMAERGFAASAFDPSYTGESSGEPRKSAFKS